MIRLDDNPEGHDGLNKYLGRDGTGQHGHCIAIRDDGKQALLKGLSEHPGRILLVQERAEGHWPWFIRFWDEDLPTVGWTRHPEAPWQKRRSWLDKVVTVVRRWLP